MNKTIGLTGGIASGKSTVTKTLRKENIPVVDADMVAREVVLPKSKGLKQIITAFGEEYLQSDGFLNRQKLGNLAFNNSEVMSTLNKIMSPLIQNESARQLKDYHDQGHDIVFYDAALILEMGNATKYHSIVVVCCTLEQQIDRLMKRGTGYGPLTKAEAVARIATQMSAEEKKKKADYIIDTSGSIEESINQTMVLLTFLRAQ